MVLYLYHFSQCGLYAVPWSHIGIFNYDRTSQYLRTFVPFSVSLWNDLAYLVFDDVRLAGFKSRANVFDWRKLLYLYYSLLLFFSFSSFCQLVGIVGLGSIGQRGCICHSLSALHCRRSYY